MIRLGKKSGCKVIACSSDSTDRHEMYLAQGADFVIFGEGEKTLEELIESLEKGVQDLRDIAGLAYLDRQESITTGKRPVLTDLDSLPFAAWDLVNMEDYRNAWTRKHGYFSLNMATTRGCPFKCNWCAKPIYGNRYNTRSPAKVAEEMEYLLREFEPDHFWMCDDIFGLKPGWVQEFRDQVKLRHLVFRYKIQSRVDLLLQEDTVEALADSGLETAWVGAESGSQKILDSMDKGTTVEQIQDATKSLRQAGIKVGFFLQFGYLGEDSSDIERTIEMVLDLLPDEIGISVSYPLPGTKFYDKVKSQLVGKANWSDSDDLDMMFSGHFQPQYYKRLHRYVHKTYRQKMGSQIFRKLWSQPGNITQGEFRKMLGSLYYLPASKVDRFRLKQLEKSR